MSKRAEEAQASALLPESIISYAKEHAVLSGLVYREGVKYGYEQAEKDTIERAAEWFRTHWREYIIGPDADGCIGFGHWENDFRKAMEEE